MTSRDRVEIALNHKEPDRVPIVGGGRVASICYLAYERLKKMLGIESETKFINLVTGTVEWDESILDRLHIDTRFVYLQNAKNYDPQWRDDNSFVDEWGVRWRKPDSSYYYDMIENPLKEATIESLDDYPWPDPFADGRTDGLLETVKFFYDKGYAVFTVVPGPFEFSTYLRGSENLFIDTIQNQPFFEALQEKLTEIMMKMNEQLLKEIGKYLSVIMYYSDLGDQRGPLINPQIWREVVKPREERIVRSIKQLTEAKVAFHTCGTFWEFRKDLLDMGIDIINPIQITAAHMDPFEIKKYYGNRMSFWGGVDGQRVLPLGSVEDVREETRKMIYALGQGGGYLFGSCHNIQNDVSPENIVAMFDEACEFGRYPLTDCA